MESILIDKFENLSTASNSHQNAAISPVQNGVDYEILSHEKNLGYLDYLNLSSSVRVLGEFFDVNCVTCSKESQICGVSLGSDDVIALQKVLDINPMAFFGSVVGFSKSVSLNSAKMLKSAGVKIIVSPDFSKDAFKYLLDTNVILVKINSPLHEIQGFSALDIKVTPFGVLTHEQNLSKLTKDNFVVVSDIKPSKEQLEDAIFGWKVSKYLKSKSSLIVKDLSCASIVQGCGDVTQAVELSFDIACEKSKDAILVLNSAISSSPVLNAAIQGRVGLIVEPGDSKNSKDMLKIANKYGISVVYTKIQNENY